VRERVVSTSTTAVILSPHPDDAVLSCGGWLHSRRAAGITAEHSHVLTIFAGRPGPDAPRGGTLAEKLVRSMGDPVDASGVRIREDRAAVTALGATPLHCDYVDAAFRLDAGRHLYPSWTAVSRTWADADRDLPGQIARDVATRYPDPGSVELCAPLAIGDHIDHRIVRDAGMLLGAAGYDVTFFEDFPYCLGRRPADAAIDLRGWTPLLRRISSVDLVAKARAVAVYASQRSALYPALGIDREPAGVAEPEVGSLHRVLCRYAASVAPPGSHAERMWRPGPPPSGESR
jgi:hypothetical protein